MIPTSVANFLLAMQAGRAGEAQIAATLAPDAVYVEPFSGTPRRHAGKPAIMAALAGGWATPLPDMTLRVDAVASDGAVILVDWTCLSPALPGGQGQGRNRYVMRGGLIAELETTFKGGPA